MKLWWGLSLKLILSVQLAFASSTPSMVTHVEQVSAVLDGQTYHAQLTAVELPQAGAKDLVINKIAITSAAGETLTTDSVGIQAPALLNGSNYVANVSEPLPADIRHGAIALAQNEVEHVRQGAPPDLAERVGANPAYGAGTVLSTQVDLNFNPASGSVAEQLGRIGESAVRNSDAAFAGLQAEQMRSNQDAARFADALRTGQNQALSLRNAAESSRPSFNASLTNFSTQMRSLHNREVENLALRIANADPKLEGILSDGETRVQSDIRRATADVSPLNPRAEENRKRYGDRFQPNGLLRDGLFQGGGAFPATPDGHRLLDSANILSNAVQADETLGRQRASRNLIGASYDFLHAAIGALHAGHAAEAERLTAQGRRIARALSGESLPDDLERALTHPEAALDLHEAALRETLGLKSSGRVFLKEAFTAVPKNTPEAQAAAALGGALSENSFGLTEVQVRDIGYTLLDLTLGMVPVVGGIKSLIYMASGTNLLTGEPLTAFDYTMCAIDVLTLGESESIAKIAGMLPKIMGAAFHGSQALLARAMVDAPGLVRDYHNFAAGAVRGIRDIEAVAPGFAMKNFLLQPGATLALGQNITRYGGATTAARLIEYAEKHALNYTETAHVSRFLGGYTKIMPVEQFDKYVSQAEMLAGKNGDRMYATATDAFEKAMKNFENDGHVLNWISTPLEPGAPPPKGLIRIDIPFSFEHNPRLPTGSEAGANAYFQKGGFTFGGAPELTLDPVPMSKVIVRGPVKY